MGNAADCYLCDNKGKPWSFGCLRCGRFDRSEQDAKDDDRSESINATLKHKRGLEKK